MAASRIARVYDKPKYAQGFNIPSHYSVLNLEVIYISRYNHVVDVHIYTEDFHTTWRHGQNTDEEFLGI